MDLEEQLNAELNGPADGLTIKDQQVTPEPSKSSSAASSGARQGARYATYVPIATAIIAFIEKSLGFEFDMQIESFVLSGLIALIGAIVQFLHKKFGFNWVI